MPTYEYEHINGVPDDCMPTIDVRQAMADAPLTICPICENPIRRCFSAIAGHVNREGGSYLKERGFTKLVKRDDGVYERQD